MPCYVHAALFTIASYQKTIYVHGQMIRLGRGYTYTQWNNTQPKKLQKKKNALGSHIEGKKSSHTK